MSLASTIISLLTSLSRSDVALMYPIDRQLLEDQFERLIPFLEEEELIEGMRDKTVREAAEACQDEEEGRGVLVALREGQRSS
jgi:hypothetical protein